MVDVHNFFLVDPYDYFFLDRSTGELRTAKPLDREKLSDTNGVLSLTVRVRKDFCVIFLFSLVNLKRRYYNFLQAQEVINGVASNDKDTSATTEVSITIRDVNDEPPKFNRQEYHVTIPENLLEGSPLPKLDMTVSDTDIVSKSHFADIIKYQHLYKYFVACRETILFSLFGWKMFHNCFQ